jgi:hypothetical protein
MLHLLGLNHSAQARLPGIDLTESQKAFAGCLRRTIEEVRPILIAEEDSADALAVRGKVSIGKEIAGKYGIEHMFCDPTEEQRRALGYRDGQSLELEIFMRDSKGLSNEEIFCKARAIEIGRYFPMREQFWLQRLNGFLDSGVVFVCGDLHIESFGNMLESKGVPCRVVQRGIGLQPEDARFDKAVQYLKEHPEVISE